MLLLLLVAYLPLSSFEFALKNDAFSDNFPNKYYFSLALHNGEFPLWNPYLNFGYPIYADFGFAYFNPITWIFGFIGYNAYTFTAEVLCYLFIAGYSMFILARLLLKDEKTAFLCGAMYMCCGFFVGNLQHINFLTGAAFLPLAIGAFLKVIKTLSYRSTFQFTLSLYMLIACGHPAIPLASFYIFIFLLAVLLIQQVIPLKRVMALSKKLLLTLILLLVLMLPMLYAYSVVLSEYALAQQKLTPNYGAHSNVLSLISLVFPFSVHSKNINWGTDISMRNFYFSIAGLLFCISAIPLSNLKYKTAFIIAGGFGLILSIGGQVRELIFTTLPFLHFIRTNGEYRVFFILFAILLSGYGIQNFAGFNKNKYLNRHTYLVLFVLLVVTGIFFQATAPPSTSIDFSFTSITQLKNNIKHFVNTLTFSQSMSLSCFFLIAILCFSYFLKVSRLTLAILICGDLIICTWFALSFTGVGKKSVAEVQSWLNSFSDKFQPPTSLVVKNDGIIRTEMEAYIGDESYYNKEIGVKNLTDYPSYFSRTALALASENASSLLAKPIFFSKNKLSDQTTPLRPSVYTPTKISITHTFSSPATLHILQNDYPFWSVFIDGKRVKKQRYFYTFMQADVAKGTHEIQIVYADPLFILLLIFCFVFFCSLIVFAFPTQKRVLQFF